MGLFKIKEIFRQCGGTWPKTIGMRGWECALANSSCVNSSEPVIAEQRVCFPGFVLF